MKKCPFCAEDIQDEAIKCKHCGEFFKKLRKWYHEPLGMFLLFLAIGPFALWFVWTNPNLNKEKKVIISVIVCILFYFISNVVSDSIKNIMQYYNFMFSL